MGNSSCSWSLDVSLRFEFAFESRDNRDMRPSDDGRGMDLMKEEMPAEVMVGKNGRFESPFVYKLVIVFEESIPFVSVIREGGGKNASWEAGTRLTMYGSVEEDDPLSLSSCCCE